MVSLVPLPGTAGIGEEDPVGQEAGDLLMAGHLAALVPDQAEP